MDGGEDCFCIDSKPIEVCRFSRSKPVSYTHLKFCNTQTGRPLPLDPEEPTHVAESIQLRKLSHAVITSVDRDDLDVYKRQQQDDICT